MAGPSESASAAGADGGAGDEVDDADRPVWARRYYLALFTAVFATLSIDRSIVSVMLEPIKAEFRLSDTALGFMNGIAFAVCFGLAGIPLGRLVDRVDRRRVLAPCVAFFSLMTILSGAARSFLQLATARLLVGAGEAGGQPAMVSMLTDMFHGRRRASAIGVYYLGQPAGALVIYLVAARLVALMGWRTAFYLAGAPGAVLSLLVWFTLKEPKRGAHDPAAARSDTPPRWGEAFAHIRARPTLLHVLATGTLMSVGSAGIVGWIVSFLIRSHHLALAHAGELMAASYVAPTAAGVLAGGAVADALARRAESWRCRLPGLALVATFPVMVGVLLAPSLLVCGVLIAVWSFLNALPYGPVVAVAQSLVPPRLRGLLTAIYYALTYTLGVGIGPQLVGVLSDLFRPWAGAGSLAWGMVAVAAPSAWAGVHMLLGARTLVADLARAETPPR
jgi:MFS family permease